MFNSAIVAFFFSYFQRCFVVGPTSERALARFLVRLTSRYRFSQWMGRGRFFPCRDGTKETTRTRPLFARRRKASGPSARSAALVGEFSFARRFFFSFFSSPRRAAATRKIRLALPPHVKNAPSFQTRALFFASFSARRLRVPPPRVCFRKASPELRRRSGRLSARGVVENNRRRRASFVWRPGV